MQLTFLGYIQHLFDQENRLEPSKILMFVGLLILTYSVSSTEFAGRVIGLVYPTCYFYKFLTEYSDLRANQERYMFDVRRTSYYFICYVHLELLMYFLQVKWLFTVASVCLVYIFEMHVDLLEELYSKCVNLDRLVLNTARAVWQQLSLLLDQTPMIKN